MFWLEFTLYDPFGTQKSAGVKNGEPFFRPSTGRFKKSNRVRDIVPRFEGVDSLCRAHLRVCTTRTPVSNPCRPPHDRSTYRCLATAGREPPPPETPMRKHSQVPQPKPSRTPSKKERQCHLNVAHWVLHMEARPKLTSLLIDTDGSHEQIQSNELPHVTETQRGCTRRRTRWR